MNKTINIKYLLTITKKYDIMLLKDQELIFYQPIFL